MTKTKADGSYSFTNIVEGTYRLRFIYGDITGFNMSDTDAIKNVLKYNGYDYIAVKTPEKEDVLNIKQLEVKNAGKGVAQVYIAIDCSISMEKAKVNIDGEEKTRLQVEVESAQKLIDSLISSGQNIYIGLIFFAGENYRAASLTRNKNLLKEALNDLIENDSNGWKVNTNIVGALDKAKASFYNNDVNNSNRYIILLSDGIPTSNGSTDVYNGEDSNQTYDKLNKIIIPSTAKKVEELKNEGIHIISFFTKSNNNLENDLVKEMFEANSDLFANVQDGWETIEVITKKIKIEVLSTTLESSYNSFAIIAGYEDQNRRNTVENYFRNNKFYYENTMLFDQINNYNPNDKNSKNKAIELSNNTWMEVNGGQNYIISYKPTDVPYEQTITHINETGEEVVDKIIYHVETQYTEKNLEISRRPLFSLKTTTTATGLKIILADNSILDLQTRDVNDFLNGKDILPIIAALDEELTHGSTIQIEYTICIQNNSNLQCDYLELINHLPKGFYYIDNLQLITPDEKGNIKHNSDYKWSIVSLSELKENGEVSKETANKYGNRTSIKLTLDNNGQGSNGFYIPAGGKCFVKCIVSKVISTLDNLDGRDYYEDVAEVLRYQNSGNSRMLYTENQIRKGGINIEYLKSIYPGDSKDIDFSEYTNSVSIIPPTGEKTTIIPILTILIITLIIFELFIFFIQKYNRKK